MVRMLGIIEDFIDEENSLLIIKLALDNLRDK